MDMDNCPEGFKEYIKRVCGIDECAYRYFNAVGGHFKDQRDAYRAGILKAVEMVIAPIDKVLIRKSAGEPPEELV